MQTTLSSCSTSRPGAAPPAGWRGAPGSRMVCRAAKKHKQQQQQEQQQEQQPEAPVRPPPSGPPTVIKEYKRDGMRIIESDAPLDGPENQKDFWEGDSFETLGTVAQKYFLPGLVVLGLICGGIAAGTYNNDADTFIAPASGPEEGAVIVKPSN